MPALQREIASGRLGEDEVWAGSAKCERDLENYQWTYNDVLQMLQCLQACDYKKSEWCEVKRRYFACDVYVLNFDCERRVRSARGLEVYLKFSIDDEGQITLVLASCHGSR